MTYKTYLLFLASIITLTPPQVFCMERDNDYLDQWAQISKEGPVKTGYFFIENETPKSTTISVRFSSDNTKVVTVTNNIYSTDSIISIYNIQTRELIQKLDMYSYGIFYTDAVFINNDTELLASCDNESIYQINLQQPETMKCLVTEAWPSAISPCKKIFAWQTKDNELYVWRFQDEKKEPACLEKKLPEICEITFSPSSSKLALRFEQDVSVYDLNDHTKTHVINCKSQFCAFNPDETMLILSGFGYLNLFDLNSNSFSPDRTSYAYGMSSAIHFIPGRPDIFLMSTSTGKTYVFSLDRNTETTLSLDACFFSRPNYVQTRYNESFGEADLSHSGKYYATCSDYATTIHTPVVCHQDFIPEICEVKMRDL